MPELPEVETIVRGLRSLTGACIREIDTSKLKNLLKNATHDEFVSRVVMMNVGSITRFGKWILMQLLDPVPGRPSMAVVSHLGMFGKWIISNSHRPMANDRITFKLSSPRGLLLLTYCDSRSWGRLYLFSYNDAVEYLKNRTGLDGTLVTPAACQNLFHSCSDPIASLLLRQSMISGIGNIYRSEILWHARIAPDRPGCDLTEGEMERLSYWIRTVLDKAIVMKGSSIQDFRDVTDSKGTFQNFLCAYARTNLACRRDQCKGVIQEDEELDGRRVYWCPECSLCL